MSVQVNRLEAFEFFKLDPNKKTILVIGGSLGARSINQAISNEIEGWKALENEIQVVWQCGKLYYENLSEIVEKSRAKNIVLLQFIQRMDLAYASADIVVSRAGALSVSELCLLGKASILVPSPNVAEDHQTKNAMSLVVKNAAILIKDNELNNKLMHTVKSLLADQSEIIKLESNCSSLAKPHATQEIVNECEKAIQ